MSTSASHEVHKNSAAITEDTMPLTDAGNITYSQLFLQKIYIYLIFTFVMQLHDNIMLCLTYMFKVH